VFSVRWQLIMCRVFVMETDCVLCEVVPDYLWSNELISCFKSLCFHGTSFRRTIR
jgi:hypothetical protein